VKRPAIDPLRDHTLYMLWYILRTRTVKSMSQWNWDVVLMWLAK
jgi:hypothetical protein